MTSDGLKAGHGKLIMKNETEYNTDYFGFITYLVVDGVEDRVHAGSVTDETDIAEQTIGAIEGEDGFTVKFDDISRIYMTVQ